MSNLNNNFESNDFDSFLNLDNDFTTVSTPHQSSASSSSTLGHSQPAFSGPSYQYESHRQQTGLPMGGLANTFAVNQASGLHYRTGNLGFVMPTETLNLPLSNLDDFDFGRSQLDMNDMDFDADSPSDLPSMFYPSGSSHIKSESSQSTPIQRIFPGMHSQQAAQAKQRQQDMLRQQEQQQQTPKALPGQLPLPSQPLKAAKDPHVEESISRLLNRMRQSSTSSVDDLETPAANGMGGIPRSKKDEEDMDDDERLLASEEGKKLSSKERRQLRNKVSARAFRSRRKEYIGQLESEIAAKSQEANDLRAQNHQLMEENTRLTDLTRMLLSSQAFSGFLQELSSSGMTLPSTTNRQQVQANPQPPPQVRKDVATHEAARQMQTQNRQQVGMTLVPEMNFDTSDFSNTWAAPLPSNDFQVFAVTSLPEPPALDLSALSDKKHHDRPHFTVSSKELPVLSKLPPSHENAGVVDHQVTISHETVNDDTTDLYAIRTVAMKTSLSADALVQSLQKPDIQITSSRSIHESNEVELSASLKQMCLIIDETYDRIQDFLPIDQL